MASFFQNFKEGLKGVVAGASQIGGIVRNKQAQANLKEGASALFSSKGLGKETFQTGAISTPAGDIARTPLNADRLSDLPPLQESVITSDTLTNNAPIVTVPEPVISEAPVVPPPPPVSLGATAPTATPEAPKEPASDPFANLKDFLGDVTPPESTADAFLEAQQSSDIIARQQKASQINAQINNIIAQGRQAQLQLESDASGKNVTTAFLGRQQQEINRQVAIQVLPLQMVAEIANNNLIAAQSNLETIFKLRSDDAKNKNDFNNNLARIVFDVASKEQQNIIDASVRQDNRDFQILQANISNARNVANSILASEPELSAEMAKIDWTSPNAQQDFASLQSQVSKDPMLVLDRKVKEAQLRELQVETAQIGQPSKAELKAIAEATKQAELSLPVARAKVESIDNLLVHDGLNTSVGTSTLSRRFFGLGGLADKLTGASQSFAGEVHRLVSGLSLDSLISAKARGATFGALSDRELTVLSNAATAINDWEIKDKNGNGKGVWNIDEKSFRTELNRIKELTNLAIIRSEGSLLDSEEESLLDSVLINQEDSSFFE